METLLMAKDHGRKDCGVKFERHSGLESSIFTVYLWQLAALAIQNFAIGTMALQIGPLSVGLGRPFSQSTLEDSRIPLSPLE